jgi:hypothetical protein
MAFTQLQPTLRRGGIGWPHGRIVVCSDAAGPDTLAWEDGGGAGATKHVPVAWNKRGLNCARIEEGRRQTVRSRCHDSTLGRVGRAFFACAARDSRLASRILCAGNARSRRSHMLGDSRCSRARNGAAYISNHCLWIGMLWWD